MERKQDVSKDRLEAFSDGVFGIVLSLLVLELHVPNVSDYSSLSRYAAAMAPLVPKLVSFVLTFVMICTYWVGHHYFFGHLGRVTIGLVWLNNFFLLWMCLLPFPTAMLGDHPTDQFPILLYAVNSLLLALTFFAIRSHARQNQLFVDGASARAMGPRHSLPGIALYSSSILLTFVNVYLSLACFFIVPLLYFMPNMIQAYGS